MHRLAEGGARGVVREDEVVCACTFFDADQNTLRAITPAFRANKFFSIGIGIVTHHFGEDLTCRDCLLGRRVGGLVVRDLLSYRGQSIEV